MEANAGPVEISEQLKLSSVVGLTTTDRSVGMQASSRWSDFGVTVGSS
jgi:hypothetical protein